MHPHSILSLSLAANIFFCLSWLSLFIPPSLTLTSSFKCSSLSSSIFPPHPRPFHNAVHRVHSCHVPTKGYMAHFLISCIVGYLGSQACLLESYLYPLLSLLTAGRTTFVDLVFFFSFFFFFCLFCLKRIKMKERNQCREWEGKKRGRK